MNTLLVLTGPTGVGKTELALALALRLGSPIINADSRQIYREIPIGTAAPTEDMLQSVKHYFVATHSLEDKYSAGMYEADCIALLNSLFLTHQTLLLTGGSMMYIDAVCKGLDDIPAVSLDIREQVREQYTAQGLEWLQAEVERLDPDYCKTVDMRNPQRLMHALEISRQTGQPLSAFRTGKHRERNFRVVKVVLNRQRESLYKRINCRVVQMMESGLQQEARSVYHLRSLNSLNTVGYKEMFAYFDGEYDLARATELIQQNTRHYAKRQLTWFRADKDYQWIEADNTNTDKILQLL